MAAARDRCPCPPQPQEFFPALDFIEVSMHINFFQQSWIFAICPHAAGKFLCSTPAGDSHSTAANRPRRRSHPTYNASRQPARPQANKYK
jgi:hypothetical protein